MKVVKKNTLKRLGYDPDCKRYKYFLKKFPNGTEVTEEAWKKLLNGSNISYWTAYSFIHSLFMKNEEIKNKVVEYLHLPTHLFRSEIIHCLLDLPPQKRVKALYQITRMCKI